MVVFALIGAFPLIIFVGGTYSALSLSWSARTWQEVPATVILSEVREHPSGRGGTVRYAYIEYEYEVGGTKHVASRCTISDPESLRGRDLAYWQNRCPLGAQITALVDRADPSNAVLDRRLTDHVGFFMVFLIAFVPLSVFAVSDPIEAILWRVRRLPAGTAVLEREHGAILRLPVDSPFRTGLGLALIPGLFAAMGWMALSAGTGSPFLVPAHVAATAGVVAFFFILGWAWKSRRVRSGRFDVVIDDAQATVTVPRGPKKSEAASFPFEAVFDVQVLVSKGAGGGLPTYSYLPTIRYLSPSGELKDSHLVEWRDEGKARALVEWLRARLFATHAADDLDPPPSGV